eukprot:CAMPEP_0179278446 /NCGR_PEP_ID=MMETSP0797-20121207/35610_1 /TAXON_ID=47934 /ORGANISM="Dinophysis acuminata, Strain DAEP01" /LENGTH=235 /DNA_ID=CAMNT_0020987059 /DNA_START=56 /DNA_END=760 /DNA_ORIENTATION=-
MQRNFCSIGAGMAKLDDSEEDETESRSPSKRLRLSESQSRRLTHACSVVCAFWETEKDTIRTVTGLFVGYGFYNTLRRTYPQQMPNIAQELQIPLKDIGLPNSGFSTAYGLAKFFGSIASDYVPCAKWHAFGVLLCGLNVAALGLCSDLQSLTALWAMHGALQAFGWPLLARIVVSELPAEQRAKYWGILSMAGNVGQMITPYAMTIAGRYGMSWRMSFFCMGGASAVMSAIIWW